MDRPTHRHSPQYLRSRSERSPQDKLMENFNVTNPTEIDISPKTSLLLWRKGAELHKGRSVLKLTEAELLTLYVILKERVRKHEAYNETIPPHPNPRRNPKGT